MANPSTLGGGWSYGRLGLPSISATSNPSIFCMILTQPRTTFKQADFFTKWLSYGPLIAKKKSQAQLHGEGSQNRPRPFSYDAHW